MPDTPLARDVQQCTDAQLLAQMAEEHRQIATRQADAAAERGREKDEVQRLREAADVKAETSARRAASRAERSTAKAALAVEAAAKVRAAAAAGEVVLATAKVGAKEKGGGAVAPDSTSILGRG